MAQLIVFPSATPQTQASEVCAHRSPLEPPDPQLAAEIARLRRAVVELWLKGALVLALTALPLALLVSAR